MGIIHFLFLLKMQPAGCNLWQLMAFLVKGFVNFQLFPLHPENNILLSKPSNFWSKLHWSWIVLIYSSSEIKIKKLWYNWQGDEPLTSGHSCTRALDYIWYSSDSLDLHSVLETLPSAEIEAGIPNKRIPSDHLSIKAVFSFC